MVVLTLGYPEQNCSYNVNYSTRKIILKEFENGICLYKIIIFLRLYNLTCLG